MQVLTDSLLSSDRLGCLRWRGSRAPEETEDTALTTTITLLKAERGKRLSIHANVQRESALKHKAVICLDHANA